MLVFDLRDPNWAEAMKDILFLHRHGFTEEEIQQAYDRTRNNCLKSER